MFDGAYYETDEVLLLLRRARARIQWRWCQGQAVSKNGAVCVLGAINLDDTANDRLQQEALAILEKAVPDKKWGYNIVKYNDMPGRKKADVIALFDRAEKLRLEELMKNKETVK